MATTYYEELVLLVGARDVYEVHRRLWRLFPCVSCGGRPFVWRVCGDEAAATVTVRSRIRGELSKGSRRELAATTGARGAFRLRCNPTFAEPIPGRRSKRRSLTEPEDVRRWLRRQGERHGFAVHEASVANAGPIYWTGRGGRRCVVGCVDVSGRIEVTDERSFIAAFLGGIGRSRAFGFGMLEVMWNH